MSVYYRFDPGVILPVDSVPTLAPHVVVPLVSLVTPSLPAEAVKKAFGPGGAPEKQSSKARK